MKTPLFLLFPILSLAAWSFAPSAEPGSGGAAPAVAARLRLPSGWESVRGETLGAAAAMISPSDSETDPFRENLTLIIRPASGLGPAERLSELHRSIEGFRLVRVSPASIGATPAAEIEFTGMLGDRQMAWIQRWADVRGKTYLFTYTAPALGSVVHRRRALAAMDSMRFPARSQQGGF